MDKNTDLIKTKSHTNKVYVAKFMTGLLCAFIVLASLLYSYIQSINVNLTEESAINSAEIYIKALEEFRTLYTTEVVTPAKQFGMDINHNYRGKQGAIPLPATLSILLGEKIGEHDGGAETRLYSPYPFPWREKDGGLSDDFSVDAWNFLTENPSKVFSRFEQVGDDKILRYAQADILREGCVNCHNSHEFTPKNDWKMGDVRGILEVKLPMAKIQAISNNSLIEFSNLLIAISVLGFGLISFFVVKNRRATSKIAQDAKLKNRINQFNDLVQDNKGLKALGDTILNYICAKVEASHGAIFVANQENELNYLAGYAISKHHLSNNSYALGEGLIGQTALDKKVLFVRDVPASYIDIESGIGSTAPSCIMLYPIVRENKTIAVIELATVGDFNQYHQAFIHEIEDIASIILEKEVAKTKTIELLQTNQQQLQELKDNQDDLTCANQVLEEQTLNLKRSEEELKSSEEELRQQSDELRATNEELEEKQDSLQTQALRLMESKRVIEHTANELEKSSKYKSEFLANMSHELRTPLNSLLILSKLLLENKLNNLTDEQLEEITIINEGGQSLLSLINDIMDLSKVEAGMLDVNIEAMPLNKTCQLLKNTFNPVAKEKGVQFTINVSEEIPEYIQSDKQRIEQVLKNFLSNAFKFTKQGSVDLTIERISMGEGNISSILKNQSIIAFSVSDTGVGIPLDKQQVIFNNFQQADGSTSREYGGTGLGLSISKELSHLLGGEIKLTSEVGKGSCFTLYLPQSIDDNALENLTEDTSIIEIKTAGNSNNLTSTVGYSQDIWLDDDRDNVHTSDKSILIIEDDEELVKSLVDTAHKLSFKTIVTNMGREGIILAKEFIPSAIILNFNMPDINGATVLEQLKNQLNLRHIPVHVLAAKENQLEAMQLGALSFQQTPVDVNQIGAIIASYDVDENKSKKYVLAVEDDTATQVAIQRLLETSDITISFASNAKQALALLDCNNFDCIILDLGLPDVSGTELVHLISEHENTKSTPIIIYTAQDITSDEEKILNQLSLSIVIKSQESPERLLDDVVLFLHHIDKNLSSHQQDTLKMLHDENEMLHERRVLIVDDDMRNVFAMTKVLEDYGLIVTQAENGQAALNAIDKSNKPFELILMDIMMPIMDGIEATMLIRKMTDYKTTPIIALTAKAMPGDKHKCVEAGASEYLTKPIDTDKLLSILRVWLYQRKVN